MKIAIERGRIIVESVHLIIDQDDVKVLVVELVSKYPDSDFGYQYGDDGLAVMMFAGRQTLYIDDSTENVTHVWFRFDSRDWHAIAAASKRTVTVCLYRIRPSDEWQTLYSPGEG